MRPLKLKISAFGPYADTQVIDFSELKDRSIFLITGPTGAGKTSILDAMCFALYGDTSSAERSGRSMRSQYASMDKLTEVVFDFELKGTKYRVYRVPEQERQKKSGTGITLQNAEASIYRLNGENEELIQTGCNKVADEIKKIIGFEMDEFRQVIILPQGQFRRLLIADSKERQDILEKIFHTEVYSRVEDILKDEAKDIKKSIEDMQSKREWSLNKVECQSVQELEDMISQGSEKLKDISSVLDEKSSCVKKAQDNLSSASEGNRKLKDKQDALKLFTELNSKIPEFEHKNTMLINARKALALVETEKMAKKRSNDKKEAELNVELKIKDLAIAENNYEISKKKYETEQKKEPEREAQTKKVVELQGYIERVKSLDSSRKEMLEAKNEADKASFNMQNMQKKLTDIQVQIEAQNAKVKEAMEYAVKAPYYETEYNKAKTAYGKMTELKKLDSELALLLNTYKSSIDDYNDAENSYISKKKQLLSLQQKWYKGQAALIAMELEEGKPCPVCGSFHHPRIAASEEDIPTEDELNCMNTDIEVLEKQKNQKRKALDELVIEKGKLEGKKKSLEDELKESSNIEIETLKKNMDDLKKLFDDASENSSMLESYRSELKNMEGMGKSLKVQLDELEKELSSKNGNYLKLSGVLREKEGSIPEDIRDMNALNAKIKHASDIQKNLNDLLESARLNFEDSSRLLTQARTSCESAKSTFKEIDVKYNDEKEAFRLSMIKAGFEKYADYEKSIMDQASIESLENSIKDFNERLKSADDAYKKACDLSQGVEFQELSKLEEILKSYEAEKETAVREENSLSEKIKSDKKMLLEIRKLDESIKAREQKYKVLGQLSFVANGQNPYGMTFQRFVLGALLDDITAAATERLRLMSKGRYLLQRTLERARKNSAGGLDLEVFDAYTGMERSVTTLSGGESFLASLSLALGLADVVQSYSGGISLDTIFVDEGFGTLDPESLDFAINTLVDLQKGGRLVGIISHVPELKERIDARLEVTPTDRGSTARFIIG